MSIIVHQDLGVGVDAKVILRCRDGMFPIRYKIGTVVGSLPEMKRARVLGEDWHEVRRAYCLDPAPALRLTLPDGTTIDLAHAQPVVNGSGKAVCAGSLRRSDEVMGRVKSGPRQVVERLLARPLRCDELVYCVDGDFANCSPKNLQVVTDTAEIARRGAWRLAPRFEVRPIKLASVKKLDKKAELCRLVCRPYFANGVLLASA